jgi:NitT/TauT family transport system permease protein
VAVWELLVATHTVSRYVLPAPWATVRSLWDGLVSTGQYRIDLWTTVKEMLIGFAAGAGVGLLLGTALATSRWVERALLPYVIFMQTVPLVAVAPLLLLWFGFGITPKVVTVGLLVLFPVTVNTLAGLKAAPQARIDLLRSFGAGRWDLLRHVRLPAAAPFIFTGLDIGIVYSPVGAIVSEFLAANQGLGIAIFQAQQNLDLPGVFALVILLGLLGIALHLVLVFIRRKVVYWQSFGTHESPSGRG